MVEEYFKYANDEAHTIAVAHSHIGSTDIHLYLCMHAYGDCFVCTHHLTFGVRASASVRICVCLCFNVN